MTPEFAALNAGGLSNNEISNTLPEELVDGNDSDITKNSGKIQVQILSSVEFQSFSWHQAP